jgi:hypothetical protein
MVVPQRQPVHHEKPDLPGALACDPHDPEFGQHLFGVLA